VSQFVDECRREWKRLGVPDPLANEMAADLTADLEEAESEGASAEEVLGTGAFDPQSFASSWAAERGLIRQSPPSRGRFFTRPGALLALLASAVLVILGWALVLRGSPGPPKVFAMPRPSFPPLVPGKVIAVPDHGFNVHTLGLLLLLVGIIGVFSVLIWWWRRSRFPLRPSSA
jgi:hypothetical protein